MPVKVARTLISPASGTGWLTIDLTSNFGAHAGSVAGIMFEIINTHTTNEYTYNVRKYGGTGADSNSTSLVVEDKGHFFGGIGVDSSNRLELYRNNTAVQLYMHAYILTSEGEFDDAPTEITLTGTGSGGPNIINASDYDNGNQAKFMFFFCINKNTGTYNWVSIGTPTWASGSNFGNYGYGDIYDGDLRCLQSPVEDDEVSFWRENSNTHLYYIGHLFDNFDFITDDPDIYNPSTSSFTDLDVSASIDPDANMIFWLGGNSSSEYSFGCRENGESYDNYLDVSCWETGFVGVDESGILEARRESSSFRFLVGGWFIEATVEAADLNISVHDCLDMKEALR